MTAIVSFFIGSRLICSSFHVFTMYDAHNLSNINYHFWILSAK